MTDASVPPGLPNGTPEAPPEPPKFRAPGEFVPPTGAKAWPGLSYSALNGYRELELDVYVPSGERPLPGAPAVLWIHGGAWLFGTRNSPPEYWPQGFMFQALIDAGIAVVAVDYRHSREAAFPAQLHDAKAAIRYVRRFASDLGIDRGRIGVWGESAGGHLAALLALAGDDPELSGTDGVGSGDTSIQAVVDFYGLSNLATMPSFLDTMPKEWIEELTKLSGGLPPEPLAILFHGTTLANAEHLAGPVNHITEGAPPFLLIHGTADTVVPYSQSVEFEAALSAAGVPVTLVPVPGADHVFVGADPVPLIEQAVAFLKEQL